MLLVELLLRIAKRSHLLFFSIFIFYIQETKVAYSDSENNSKGCVTAISSSSAITTESSKAEAKERRQQLKDTEKQQKVLEKESARIQQAYEKEQKLIARRGQENISTLVYHSFTGVFTCQHLIPNFLNAINIIPSPLVFRIFVRS